MESLPDEVLMMIFELLPARDALGGAARVCRRWEALVARRALDVQRRDDLQRLHRGIVALQVSSRLDSLRSFLAATTDIAPSLHSLTVPAANPFGDENLAALFRFPYLNHLDVFMQSRMLDKRLLPVLLRLSCLVVNESVPPGVLRALARSRRLRELHMYGRALYYVPRELGVVLRARRLHLSELTLRCAELTDPAYHIIGECVNLTSLQLYSCWLMRDAGARAAVRPQSLRRLHITGARMLRPRALTTLIDHLPLLIEELVLSATWFGAVHVMPLVTRLPALRLLELWRCDLTSDHILMLADALPELRNLDVDTPLPDQAVNTLFGHPSLRDLRCLFDNKESVDEKPCQSYTMEDVSSGRVLRVKAADARYPRRFLRGGGEGYRAALFYYCSQERELTPLPVNLHPGFDEDDDDDYYPLHTR